MKRENKKKIFDALETELENLYHNATLSGNLTTESDFEADLVQELLQTEIDFAFESIGEECPSILDYGQVYQWGRGGRTVAPDSLIESRGFGWRVKRAEELELGPKEALALLETLRAFNQLVHSFCSSAPDSCIERAREEYSEELSENAGKSRVHYSGVRYE